MKKDRTIDEVIKELEEQKQRAELFKDVIKKIDDEIRWLEKPIVIKEGYYEDYTDDEGNEKRRWHMPVCQTDEDGNEIRIAPTEEDWGYDKYVMWNRVKDEIIAIV